ncbi:hypothetical protein, partial [Faecalibacterium sp. An121]|uniref:hypothetical protein n=1 Tax=Faecalibacterium sp. An121 TaxID=1965550 RepID=UPI00406C9442
VRLDAVPYIWKQLGTSCRNLPQVHTIVRMIRMICEIVCPKTASSRTTCAATTTSAGALTTISWPGSGCRRSRTKST